MQKNHICEESVVSTDNGADVAAAAIVLAEICFLGGRKSRRHKRNKRLAEKRCIPCLPWDRFFLVEKQRELGI